MERCRALIRLIDVLVCTRMVVRAIAPGGSLRLQVYFNQQSVHTIMRHKRGGT